MRRPLHSITTHVIHSCRRLRTADSYYAWTGTPVIDIKPYDYYDIVKKPKVPREFEDEWVRNYAEKGYGDKVPWLGPCF